MLNKLIFYNKKNKLQNLIELNYATILLSFLCNVKKNFTTKFDK